MPQYIDDALWPAPSDDMFVRPNWPGIRKAIEEEIPGDAERAAAWKAALNRWIERIAESLNGLLEASATRRHPYRIDRSEHFSVVASYSADIAGEIPQTAEGFRNLARQSLTPRIAADPPGTCPIFIFHDPHVAQEYLGYFKVNAFAIAGVCIGSVPQHIVMHTHPRMQQRLVLIHELNHAVLHALPLPNWIHEGLSRFFETKLLTMANMRFTAEMDLGRNRFWRENGLADFWSGRIFFDERATHGYVLALKFLRGLMARNPDVFADFLQQANRSDSGESACQKVYGHSLLELTQQFLGKGDWAGPAAVAPEMPEQPETK